jgi:acyl-coenzyme A thioesterase PaaI-like protein
MMVGDWSGDTWGANALIPEFAVDRSSDHSVTGRVTFTPFHHGGGGAVHGGVIPMVFDQVLGRLTNVPGRGRARTAYLHVNYRQVTPIGTELRLDATIEREEGRKIFAGGRLRRGEELLADAEALFVRLRPGQA